MMKTTFYKLSFVLALVALMATAALADDHMEKKPAAKMTDAAMMGEMHKCCLAAAEKGEGCCGHTAEEVKAQQAMYISAQAVKADMHECCAKALADGKGCCGKSAEALRADFEQKVVAHHKAACESNVERMSGCAPTTSCAKSCGPAAKAGCGSSAKAKDKDKSL